MEGNLSFENAEVRRSLNDLGYLNAVMATSKKYRRLAELMNYTPTTRGRVLKEGSVAYKQSILNELLRRGRQHRRDNTETTQRNRMRDVRRQVEARPRIAYATKRQRVIESARGFRTYQFDAVDVSSYEDFYNVIKSVIDNNPYADLQYITILFKSRLDNKVRGLSLNANDFETFDDFYSRIYKHINGEIVGSDAYSSDDYEIVMDYFRISSFTPINYAFGKSDKMVFVVDDVKSKKGTCGIDCLEHLGYKIRDEDKPNLITLAGITKYISDKNLPISVLLNYIGLKDGSMITGHINAMRKEKRTEKNHKGKPRDEEYTFYHITDDNINLHYYWYVEDCRHTLVYCENSKHIDIITDNRPTLKEGIERSSDLLYWINGKKLWDLGTMIKNDLTRPVPPMRYKYLIFDFETVIDFDMECCMKPYSLSILNLSRELLDMLEIADKEKDENTVQRIRRENCHTFLGFDCVEKFLDWFSLNHLDTIFCFVGYNNANFDNYLMLDGFLRSNKRVEYDFWISKEFYNGGQLLNFKINGRHHFYDIHKHIVFGSLKDNCKSFKINCCAKKDFSHQLAQELYERNELLNYINENPELREYNEYDVLATAVLMKRYMNELEAIPSIPKDLLGRNFTDTMTIGSMIWKTFKHHSRNIKEKSTKPLFEKLSLQHYTDMLKYKVAGRVEMFNGVQKVSDKMVSTDVCSLYPYVMAVRDVYYPCGEIIETEEYMGDNVCGFYYCDIDQSNLRLNNLPLIYPKKTESENDWGHNEILTDYLINNVDIRLMRKYGCNITIKKGFYFGRQVKNFEMFPFLLEMMKAKNQQDEYKRVGDTRYNPALRETLKLLMNSISGKVIEGLHTEKIEGFNTAFELREFFEKKCGDGKNKVNMINSVGGRLYVNYEVDVEEIIDDQRPVFLGCYVYAYAREYMYEMSYSKIGLDKLLYTDTDASKFRKRDFDNWYDWVKINNIVVPHWVEVEDYDDRYRTHLIYDRDSKVFGSFEDELDGLDGDNYEFICLQKKSWCYSVFKDGKEKSKYRFKGINGRAIPLTLTENFIMATTNRKGVVKFHTKPESEYEIHNWINDNENKKLDNCVNRFFNDLYNNGFGYVMTTSFRKIVKNTLRDVREGEIDRYNGLMNKIVVGYVMKKITINVSRDEE